MRRFLAIPGTLLVILVLALTACSSSSTTPNPTAAPANSGSGTGSTPSSGGAPAKSNPPAKIGAMCDRSGAVSNIGTKLCDGTLDYVKMINDKGGVNGRTFEFIEVDNKYEVPTAQQIYKRYIQQDKVVGVISFGTPITDALAPSAADDKVPLLTPGFGLSASEDGTKFPYVFVGASSYNSQIAAEVAFIKELAAKQNLSRPKVVYFYLDNPAGRDPIETLKALATKENLDLQDLIPVPVGSGDVSTQVSQVKAKTPDFVLNHTAGKIPQISLIEFKKQDVKATIINFVWAASEEEIEVAGTAAENVYGLQFTALAEDNPQAYKDLLAWWQSKGQQPNPKSTSVYYARGVLNAAMFIRAMELAGDGELTGEMVKAGFEKFKDEKLSGMAPGLTMSASDHGGTRKVKMYQVQGGKWKLVKDWFEGTRP